MREKKKKKEEGSDIDFGIGKIGLGLGGLFKGIEKLVDLAAELKEAGGEIKKEGEIDLSHLKEGMKGIFGFSVKTMAGGRPVVEPFGNIKKTPKGPTVEEVREPIIDIFDEKEEVRLYAEIPGVSEEKIETEISGDILKLSAENTDRKYAKEILLPSKVKAETLEKTYKNGVLEIKIEKA